MHFMFCVKDFELPCCCNVLYFGLLADSWCNHSSCVTLNGYLNGIKGKIYSGGRGIVYAVGLF